MVDNNRTDHGSGVAGSPLRGPFHGYRSFLPGAIGIGIVMVFRLVGLLQPLEWMALDAGLRWRPPEPTDERVVIVGINEKDIRAVGAYPIPDGELARLLRQLQVYNARVVGLDIARDIPVEPGYDDLVTVFASMPNLIGAKSIVPDRFGTTVQPPPALPPAQIGFVDNVLDADGKMRRSLLGAMTEDGFQFAKALRLAEAYLKAEGLELENGIRNPFAMRFGSAEIDLFEENSGGYAGADAGGVQTLLNFRSGAEPFRVVSMMDVLEGRADPEWFRDRVVLVGITALSAKDMVQSAAVASSNPGLVFGVEIKAHAVSQILSAALDGRSLLRTWPNIWEYGWILLWGGVGIGLGRWVGRSHRYFLLVTAAGGGLLGLGYAALLGGWWLPVVPALLAFLLNGVVIHSFHLYSHSLTSRVTDRQRVIDQTFNAIHNGPLQTLASLMREVEQPDCSPVELRANLKQLNQELRDIYQAIQQEAIDEERLYLPSQISLSLTTPLQELLYEVYNATLRRDFPHFQTIRAKVVTFEPFDEAGLTLDCKRGLCRFLEEALCNVGKHAVGATRLVVECRHNGVKNVISVMDNGAGAQKPPNPKPPAFSTKTAASGRGTQQAHSLAAHLGGEFRRYPRQIHSPAPSASRPPRPAKGMVCELTWKPHRPLWQRLRTAILAGFGKKLGRF